MRLMRITRKCDQRQFAWDTRGIIKRLLTLMKCLLAVIVVEMDCVGGDHASTGRGLDIHV